ncbi:thiolase family protein [uncultured Jatrophihabitans sp.]|uniref:thiolase family protein n=1 Tax=uncultured Jatrophihabitans sp. TaxID=1610747 RepID=UPI0035CAD033
MSALLLGAGEADRVPTPGRTAVDLGVDAALAALADAGLEVGDIDGVVTGYSLAEQHLDFSADLAESLGIRPRWSQTVSRSGATGASVVVDAVLAVLGGACDRALAVWSDNRASGPPADIAGVLAGQLSRFEAACGPLIATQYAMIARSYMARWKATPEDLAGVAVQFRKHAGLNERAKYRTPITVDDVLSSPVASSPLHLLECALVTDYGGAVVVSRPGAAPAEQGAVRVLGFGEALSHQSILRNDDLFTDGVTAAAQSSRTAFEMAGMTPADLQMAQIYDCFTITVLMLMEDFGLSERGGAGAAVADGFLDREGPLPANTGGGMLSNAAGGILHVTEAVRQMRGNAGAHQLPSTPETALVHGNGGILGAQTTLLLARA